MQRHANGDAEEEGEEEARTNVPPQSTPKWTRTGMRGEGGVEPNVLRRRLTDEGTSLSLEAPLSVNTRDSKTELGKEGNGVLGGSGGKREEGGDEADSGAKLKKESPVRQSTSALWVLQYVVEELGPREEDAGDSTDARKDEMKIYNTIFRVPFELERVLSLGAYLCADAVLAAVTILPARALRAALRLGNTLSNSRSKEKANDVTSLAWFLILGIVSYILTRVDISIIYHYIRSQETIKLYVVFNILDIFDKLFLSFNVDTFEALALRARTSTNTRGWQRTFTQLQKLGTNFFVATLSVLFHAMIVLCQAVTLNVALNTAAKGLLPLLISSQFMEVKGFVFKRMDYTRLFTVTCQDIAERVNILLMVIFVLVHSALAAKGRNSRELIPEELLYKVAAFASCELVVDWLKHAFLSKYNNMYPSTYRQYLVEIGKRRNATISLYGNRTVNFVPLAHAALFMRLVWAVMRTFPVTEHMLGWAGGFVCLLIFKLILGAFIKGAAALAMNCKID